MMDTFEQAAREAGFALDDAQRAAAARLARLGAEVAGRRRFFAGPPPRGLYVWGPVGRGKSWLTEVFYEALPLPRKHRVHFHEFFREFHTVYARHRRERNACDLAVAELLGDCRLLFFDEFHVHDPGDAMMMGRVLASLFERRITLVATSNYPPAGLLPNPVHHHMFEPTIALLEASLDVVEVAGPRDYRTDRPADGARSRFGTGRFLWPADPGQLRAVGLEPPTDGEHRQLDIGGRTVTARAVRDGLVWFDFHELCGERTSTIDFLTLADRYDTWVLAGVPRLSTSDRDTAQRFANLVDVLHDRDTRLHLLAEAPLTDCLQGDALPVDINRTLSRLRLLDAA
ncbi:cell division protein ZapE [Streptomyces sp. NRRL S-495]|uniref:cell division protein ZapE n=1 Tax=Streptomyces sp. NRRL S-495 TaxID=1609133 RepID=UPI0005F8FD76|nr:cell division protein ZapE [Streptomyces sp. NRRL S-495]KJY30470.1 ATPase [Streptomyces sp. NRRL S-495]